MIKGQEFSFEISFLRWQYVTIFRRKWVSGPSVNVVISGDLDNYLWLSGSSLLEMGADKPCKIHISEPKRPGQARNYHTYTHRTPGKIQWWINKNHPSLNCPMEITKF